jgi:hexosaminidase
MELIPAPRSFEARPGLVDLARGGKVSAPPGFEGVDALAALWLNEALGPVSPPFFVSGEGRSILSLSAEPSLGPESYVLDAGPRGIAISAGDRSGAVHAVTSLRQLALSGGPRFPACRVGDGPRFPWRGAMLDCARNFLRIEFIERFIDLMALHKLNRFHWHLTDDQAWRLELDCLPEIARAGSRRLDSRIHGKQYKEGSYSKDDVKRVVSFAAERGIEVVPEIETPGHVLALLASHPELSCAGEAPGGGSFSPEDRYGIFEDVLCAGNDGTLALMEKIFSEVAQAFPGPWIHSGGDEVPKARWLHCEKCGKRMRDLGMVDGKGNPDPERLQAWFMGRVADILASKGKRMFGWDEVLDGGIRKDVLVMSWRGHSGGARAARAGHQVVMCPQTKACYLDHKPYDSPEEPGQLGVCTVKDSYSYEPMPEGLSPEESALVLGGQANLWTELMYFGRQVEYMAFPRLSALAEVFWSPREKRDFADFSRRLVAHGLRLDALGVNRYRGPLA